MRGIVVLLSVVKTTSPYPSSSGSTISTHSSASLMWYPCFSWHSNPSPSALREHFTAPANQLQRISPALCFGQFRQLDHPGRFTQHHSETVTFHASIDFHRFNLAHGNAESAGIRQYPRQKIAGEPKGKVVSIQNPVFRAHSAKIKTDGSSSRGLLKLLIVVKEPFVAAGRARSLKSKLRRCAKKVL